MSLVLAAFLTFAACSPAASPSSTSTSPPPLTSTTSAPFSEPVAVVSVSGPIPPYNPGGPVVEITLNNVSSVPVITLSAILELNRAFTFTFEVTPSNPLMPGASASVRQTLIGGGLADNVSYPLTINGTLQGGADFAYTKQVLITSPAQ